MKKIKFLMTLILIFALILTVVGCNRVDPKTNEKDKIQNSKTLDGNEEKAEIKLAEENEEKIKETEKKSENKEVEATDVKLKNIEDYLPYEYDENVTYNIIPSSIILKAVDGNNQYSGFTTRGKDGDTFAFSTLTRISCDANTYDTAWVLFNENNEVIDEVTDTVMSNGGILSYLNYNIYLPVGEYTVAYFIKKSNTEDSFVPATILDFKVAN